MGLFDQKFLGSRNSESLFELPNSTHIFEHHPNLAHQNSITDIRFTGNNLRLIENAIEEMRNNPGNMTNFIEGRSEVNMQDGYNVNQTNNQ